MIRARLRESIRVDASGGPQMPVHYGVSCPIVPAAIDGMTSDPDPSRSKR